MIENGTLLQERYLIERQIGAGGMGAVYLAVDQRFENHVAIKETFFKNDEFGDAFEREARLLNGLQHPVLPHVSDYFTDKHGHFLVMQFIEGEDLSAILKREGAFPVKDVLRWIDNLLDALDYLHSQNPPIIHRDIKPQNLKITPRNDIILLDFGLAKLKSEDTSGVKSVFGYSRKYSSLEQIQGTGTDARSDIFSLGATAYHLLTGKPPIDVLARAAEIVVGNPDPIQLASEINSEIPSSVAYVLNSALALNPAARFVSAGAMRQALEYAINAEDVESVEPLPVQTGVTQIPFEEPVISSHESEDFTALEAFAESEPAIAEGVETEVAESLDSKIETPLLAPENLPRSKSAVETLTRIAVPRLKKPQISFAAVFALLICVGLVAGYFINKVKSPNIESQNPVIETTQELGSSNEQSDLVLESPSPEGTQDFQAVEQAKTQSVSVEKAVEKVAKRETVDKPETKTQTVEKSKVEAAPRSEPRRAQTAQSRRRNDAPQQTQPRVIVTEPFPDIESIFTGRPTLGNERVNRREERRKQREKMQDEERRDSGRDRRQDRRPRQNDYRFPF